MTRQTSEENRKPKDPRPLWVRFLAGGVSMGMPADSPTIGAIEGQGRPAGGPPSEMEAGVGGRPMGGPPSGIEGDPGERPVGGPPPGRRGGPPQGGPTGAKLRGNPFVMLQIMIIMALVCGIYYVFGLMNLPTEINIILFPVLFSLPLMFVSSVYGFPFGIICYIIVELITLVFATNRLYMLSYQLLALFSTNAFMSKRFYRRFKNTFDMILASAFISGTLLNLIMWLSEGEFEHFFPGTWMLHYYVLAFLERFTAFTVLFLFYRFLPPKILHLFPVSGFRREDRVKQQGISEFYGAGRSALGKKVGSYMVIEATLFGLITVPYMLSLFPGNFVTPIEIIRFAVRVNLYYFSLLVPMVVVVNFLVQTRITNPIVMITKGMKEFAENTGEDRTRAETFIRSMRVHTGDELENLYKSMTDMVTEVNGYIDRMEEEKKLEEDLRVAQAANEAKTHFISHMSHEIRTPINAVIGMDEMIMRETQEKNILHYARDIRNAGRSLLSIVNDILDFSRIESGKLEIIEGEYEMSSVLNDLVSMIQPRVREKGLDFKTRVDETLPHVLIGDEVRLRQCILNILTNAVKYTQQGKIRLIVTYEEAGDEKIALTVSVEDSGAGIKKEELEKLLMPFERIDEVHNRTIEGTGLGLAITSNLLGLMGSKIEVESEYGRGSNFHFTLMQGVANREPIGDFNEMHERLAAQETQRHVLQAPGIRVLAVDDTHTNLTVIKGLLKETGIIVDTAASGKEMLDKVTEVYYDLIFLDQRMPVMDGIEALHLMQMMTDVRNPDAPVVALTANVISGAREMFLREGFDDYLPKPIDAKELENVLLKYLPEGRVQIIEKEVQPLMEETGGELDEMRDLLKNLAQTDELDIDMGLKNCGDADTFIETVRDFHHMVRSSADALEQALAREDYEDYGIRVHSLKSTARVVGALELSKQAMQEEAWCDAGEYEKLKSDAPSLLARYRAYYEALSFMKDPEEEEDPESGEEITEEKLREAYSVIRELTDAFDYDTASDVYRMLKDFRIPKEEQMLYNEIGESLRRLDRDRILELIAKG